MKAAPVEGGGVRIAARDWPGAPWVAAPLLAVGLPLAVWSAFDGRPVEGGGAAVFVGVGAFAAWLAAARRRDLVVTRGPDGVRVRGREGAGPLARPVDLALPAAAVPEVRPFGVPAGAPDLPDRGGDLVLTAPGVRVLLARRAGPSWRRDLEPALGLLRDALAKDDSRGPAA